MDCHTYDHNRPSQSEAASAGSMPQQEFPGKILANPAINELYRVQLDNFTSDILGDMADRWIRLFGPQLSYQGPTPEWWPATITFMSPRRMLKHVRVMLLQELLCWKLMDYSTNVLEAAVQSVPRLHNSDSYRNSLTKILDVFRDGQKRLEGTIKRPLEPCSSHESRLVRPAILIRKLAGPEQSFPAPLADLTSNFCVEWLSFSAQGMPLHAKAMSRCELRDGSLNTVEGPTLQQPSVAQEIRMDARIGILKLVVVHNPLPISQSGITRSYLAFSIRIAASLNGLIEKAIARGWEDISGIIAEIENQYLV